nr:MAG TPA: hypothetical protein [Caudoviricetes sp.]
MRKSKHSRHQKCRECETKPLKGWFQTDDSTSRARHRPSRTQTVENISHHQNLST